MADIFVCRDGDLKDGDVRIVSVRETEVGVFRHAGKYYAYRNVCLHQGGPACEGMIIGKVEEIIGPDKTLLGQRFNNDEMHFVCPWHGWEFKIETGECAADTRLRLQRFNVTERDGGVYVAI